MLAVSVLLSISGISASFWAALVLLPAVFAKEEELEFLDSLPLEDSGTRLTSAQTAANLAVVLTDPSKLRDYKTRFAAARREERRKGVAGLRLLVVGLAMQVAGQIVGLFLPN